MFKNITFVFKHPVYLLISHTIGKSYNCLFMSLLLKFIFIAILMLSSALSANAQVNATQVCAIGRNLISMEDYALSKLYFNMAIKARPQWDEPYYYRALAKLYLDDLKGAEDDCSAAIERHPFKTDAYKLRGYIRQQLGKDSLAILDYETGLQHNPIERDFLFYKAIAHTSLKDFDAADSTYKTLLRFFPKFGEGYSGRAQMNLQRGDTVAAIEDLDKSISISKNLINSYLMRAEVMMKRKSWDNALADIDMAIKLRPQEADYYLNRGYVRYSLDDFFGAMSDYNYAVELEPFNTSALFNRALLRYEVKDLINAEADFSTVLKWDSSNFHARFNRGLVYLELNKNKEAIADFNIIAKRYPKFYPVYYGIAKAYLNLGDNKKYMQFVIKANDMIGKYIQNPEKNPLDRPTIDQANSNDAGSDYSDEESEIEVMNRFNQLVTVKESDESRISYNSKIKGRVQDRNVRVEIEPLYSLTFFNSQNELQSRTNFARDLDAINQAHYLDNTLYISNDITALSDNEQMQALFDKIESLNSVIASGRQRPVDYLARGVLHSMLKNYQAAVDDLNIAISLNPDLSLSYIARAFATDELRKISVVNNTLTDNADPQEKLLSNKKSQNEIILAMNDLDTAISLDANLSFAWFNKGNLFFEMQDMTSALNCYSQAIRINPEFGQAFFNRGLVYLQMGNKLMGNADLRKAGELGILPSYNVLKRMN